MKKLLAIIFALGLMIPSVSFGAKAWTKDSGGTLSTGLVSYWALNADPFVDSFSVNDLTNVGSTVTSSTAKNGGFSADFGASNSSKYLSIDSNLGITGGAISFADWINVTTAPASNVAMTFNLSADNSASSYTNQAFTYRDSGGTKQMYWIRTRNGIASTENINNYTLTPGTWYHVVATYDGTTLKTYVNGTKLGVETAASGTGANLGRSSATSIGAQEYTAGTANEYFSGLVDETAIWSKALTQTEITDLYNSGTGSFYQDVVAPNVVPLMKVFWWF